MNRSGQAFTEALFLLTLCTLGSVKLILLGLHLLSQIVVEDLLEQSLICKFQNNPSCISELRNKLHDLDYSSVQVIDRSQKNLARIAITWQTSADYKATLESELSFDLSVP